MRVHTRPGRLAALALVVATSLPALLGCTAEAEADTTTDPTASPAKVRPALVELYAGDHASGDDTAAAECFADALLEQVAPEDLRDGGVLDGRFAPRAEPAPLDEPVAVAWTEAQMACTDFVAESTQAQEDLTQGELDAGAYAACLDARLPDATIREATISTLLAHFKDPAVVEMSRAQSD